MPPRIRAFLNHLIGLVIWLFISCLFGVPAGLITAIYLGSIAPLSDEYPYYLFLSGIFAVALMVGLLGYFLSPANAFSKTFSQTRNSRKQMSLSEVFQTSKEWIRNNQLKAVTYSALALLAIGGILGLWVFIRTESSELATSANTHFRILKVVSHDQDMSFDERALKIELERAYQRISQEWANISAEVIQVHIYPDQESFLRATGLGKHTAGATSCAGNAANIHVYLEDSPNDSGLRVDPETARHETAHAVMCQVLGSTVTSQIPDWIHEGYARLAQYGAWSDWYSKSSNRLRVWLGRSGILSGERFCSFDVPLRDESSDIGFFYATAWEFVRWLDGQEGDSFAMRINNAFEETEHPEQAISIALGQSCETSFDDWLKTFEGGPQRID